VLVGAAGTGVVVDVSPPQAESSMLPPTASDIKSMLKRVFFIRKLSSSIVTCDM